MTDTPASDTQDYVSAVDHVIQNRKTAKILRDPTQCSDLPEAVHTALNEMLHDMIALAGWAPFHKLAHKPTHQQGTLNAIVPWRFYVLEKAACCRLIAFIETQAEAQPDSKWSRAWGSKIPKLLSGCGALVMAMWLPDPSEDGDAPELNENNIEHIAATSAAIQNLLLLAEARDLHSYWSSGGILNDADVFAYLGIPSSQKLLGAIFITPEAAPHDENQPGKLRDQRGQPESWSTWLTLDE